MLRVLLLALLLTLPAHAVPRGAIVGSIQGEVAGQVAVYRCEIGPMTGVQAGDVVAVMHAGQTLGEAMVVRAEPLVVSLKGVFSVQPGDLVVYLRTPRAPEAPRPARTASPPPVAVAPAPAVEEAPGIAPAPGIPGADPPPEPPAPAPSAAAEPPAPAPQPSATPAAPAAPSEDQATLAKWQGELDRRLGHYVRPQLKGKQTSPHVERAEKAEALTAKGRYLEAASIYSKLAASLQKEGLSVLGGDARRGREAWSLGLESLGLRALCFYLAEEPGRARAAFEALARENPKGALAAARALSTIRVRANTWLAKLRDR